jgi:hypothetical protein
LKDDDDLPNSKPLNNKARRSKVSKQELSPTSKTQADKAQNKISKTYGEPGIVSSSSTNREEESKTLVVISKINDNKPSSRSRPTKSNVTSKLTKKTGQSNKITELDNEIHSEKELETALSIKRTSKSAEASNKEKQKPNVTRSRAKRKINASSDDDDNKSNVSVPVSTTKGSDLEEPVLPPPKRSKQIKINTASDMDEEPNSKIRVKGKVNETGQSRRKIEPVEDGGVVMALENKLLAQDSDIIESKSGDDVESDNTIKEDDDREVLKRTSEPEEDGHTFQDNSTSVDEVKQELSGLKVESKSPKRTLDFKDEDEDDDLSSLEDIDKPRNKKHKTEKVQTKSVNNKTEKAPTKPVNNKPVDDKLVNDDNHQIIIR